MSRFTVLLCNRDAGRWIGSRMWSNIADEI